MLRKVCLQNISEYTHILTLHINKLLHEFNIYHSCHVTCTIVEWNWYFPCHKCNVSDFLQHIIVYCTAAYKKNKGPLSELNNNHIVTSQFHHKTKQHQTSLNWTEQHCGPTIDLKRLRSERNGLRVVFTGCCRSSVARWDNPNLASRPQINTRNNCKKRYC